MQRQILRWSCMDMTFLYVQLKDGKNNIHCVVSSYLLQVEKEGDLIYLHRYVPQQITHAIK